MRLLAGVLAGQAGRFELAGDDSLSRRPMERVAEPLRRMGAEVETADGPRRSSSRAVCCRRSTTTARPLGAGEIGGAPRRRLHGRGDHSSSPFRHVTTPSACSSVQVQPFDAALRASPSKAERLSLGELEIPGDFSSAAALLVAAVTVPGSDVTVHGVGLSPRRTGLLDVLERMGARVAVYNRRPIGGEPAGDVQLRASELVGATVTAGSKPRRRAAAARPRCLPCAGRDRRHGRGRAPAQESDRIDGVVEELRRIGAHIRATSDGFRIRGVPARLRGGTVNARGDHRLAMVGAVAGLSSREGVDLRGAEAVETSFPGFFRVLAQLSTV